MGRVYFATNRKPDPMQPNGFGASVAAPIARAILEKLLHG